MPRRVGYLGLGSNIGDRHCHLARAVSAMPAVGVRVLECSAVYETEPVGEVSEQREFLNAAVRVQSDYEPEELLRVCKSLERALGRAAAGVRHGPRTIDIDLLMLGSLQYSSERLTLPHPSITERRFVLVPLLELDPELALPDGTALAESLAALGENTQSVRRVRESLEL